MAVAVPPLECDRELLPGYLVISHLSRGRRLDVYDGWSTERGCRCILKTLRPERACEQRARELLREEGELLQRLTHPHLVRVYETVPEPTPTIVMETLAGETLAHMIESGRDLTAAELGHLALQLGSAIRYLHLVPILHLDLKPSNILAEAGRAKLIDLSVARRPGVAPPGVGTPDYMAPEQARGGELGPAADVWGIGVVLYEAATGERAFRLEGDRETDDEPSEGWSEEGEEETPSWYTADGDYESEDYAQLSRRAEPLSGRDGVDERLGRLVDACLDPDPAGRPELAELLARAEELTGMPGSELRWSPTGGGGPA